MEMRQVEPKKKIKRNKLPKAESCLQRRARSEEGAWPIFKVIAAKLRELSARERSDNAIPSELREKWRQNKVKRGFFLVRNCDAARPRASIIPVQLLLPLEVCLDCDHHRETAPRQLSSHVECRATQGQGHVCGRCSNRGATVRGRRSRNRRSHGRRIRRRRKVAQMRRLRQALQKRRSSKLPRRKVGP